MRHEGAPDYQRIKQFRDMAFRLMQQGRVSESIEDWDTKTRVADLIATQLVYVKDLQDEVAQLKMEIAERDHQLRMIAQICEKGGEDDA